MRVARAGPAPAAVATASPRGVGRAMSPPMRGVRRLLQSGLSVGFSCPATTMSRCRGDVKRPASHALHSADALTRTSLTSNPPAWRTPHFRQIGHDTARVSSKHHAFRPTVVAALSTHSHRTPSTLVIVESPAKAVSVQKYLGPDHLVLASYGHVRDLVTKAGSVIPENEFEMVWAERGAGGVLRDIFAAARNAEKIVLATDPDREGEAISWHILELLTQKGIVRPAGENGKGRDAGGAHLPKEGGRQTYPAVQRVTFTEVTKSAVLAAFSNPRQVSEALVDAYLARRALDYLFGFSLSGVLWRKMPSAQRLSAGRVQSVALRLICDREFDIEKFTKQEFWTIACDLRKPGNSGDSGDLFVAELTHVHGTKVGKMDLACLADAETAALDVLSANDGGGFSVADVSEKEIARKPKPPFTTSTMQQEASSKLGFGAGRTMSAAQALYEGRGWGEGLITYMRTDGLHVSNEAVGEIRNAVTSEFGADYVPRKPNVYKSKQKNAQEAHEACRPVSVQVLPLAVGMRLGRDTDEARLYKLIWARTVSSQMTPAITKRVVVDVRPNCSVDSEISSSLRLRANGSQLVFPGYLAAYGSDFKGRDSWLPTLVVGDRVVLAKSQSRVVEKDKHIKRGFRAANVSDLDEDDTLFPSSEDEQVALSVTELSDDFLGVTSAQHWTQPPGRYTEGTLVKALEEKGIGRPSTYASILKVITKRGYITSTGGRGPLVPETRGRLVSVFLSHFFAEYVDYGFTAALENALDDVANGERKWRDFLRAFWTPFTVEVENLKLVRTSLVVDVLDATLGVHFFGDDDTFLEKQMKLVTELTEKGKLEDRNLDAPYPVLAFDRATLPEKRKCPSCGTGRLGLKLSRTGGFIGCSNYPECGHTASLVANTVGEGGDCTNAVQFPIHLGFDPHSTRKVSIRNGPYGPYVELEVDQLSPEAEAAQRLAAEVHEASELAKLEKQAAREAETAYEASTLEARANGLKPPRRPKPKKVKLAKSGGNKKTESKARRFGLKVLDISCENVTLELALDLLAYPLVLGTHPSDQTPVVMNAGPFGWYVSHAGVNASLSKKLLLAERAEAVRQVKLTFGQGGDEVSESIGGDEDDMQSWAEAGRPDDDAPGDSFAGDTSDGNTFSVGGTEQRKKTNRETGATRDAALVRASFGPVSLATAVEVLARKRSKPPGGKGGRWGKKKKGSDEGTGDGADTEVSSKTKKKAKAETKKAKPKPKRAPSAYLLFCAETRGSLPDGLFVTEQAKLLGAYWKALGDTERLGFEHAAKQAKDALFAESSASAGSGSSAKASKPKKKRTPSAYLLFCAETRADLPEGLRVPEQAKLLGASWKRLGDVDKSRFENAAKQAKEQAAASA